MYEDARSSEALLKQQSRQLKKQRSSPNGPGRPTCSWKINPTTALLTLARASSSGRGCVLFSLPAAFASCSATSDSLPCKNRSSCSSSVRPHLNNPEPALLPSPAPLSGWPGLCELGERSDKKAAREAWPGVMPHDFAAMSAHVRGPTKSVRAALMTLDETEGD